MAAVSITMGKLIAGIVIAILASSAISVGASMMLALDQKDLGDHKARRDHRGQKEKQAKQDQQEQLDRQELLDLLDPQAQQEQLELQDRKDRLDRRVRTCLIMTAAG